MPGSTMRSRLAGLSLFAAGWLTALVLGGGPLAPAPGRAAAPPESDQPRLEQSVLALMYGVATVAIDAEAAAERINQLADRHATLERRVAQLEAQSRR